jgi:antirestriction protein ArdC
MDSSGWDLDSKIFHSILSGVKANNKDFIKEWMENYTGVLHYNASTKREYQSLLSWIVLSVISCHCKYKYNLWASKLEWKKAGYSLKKNAQMAFVFHYFSVSGSDDESQDDFTDRYAGFGRKLSVVYNIDEVEGDLAGDKFYGGKHKIQELDDSISRLNIAVTFCASNSAYYDASADHIVVPDRAFFKNNNKGLVSYYSTLLHEIVHWTGHQSRCNRNLSNDSEEAYALEELVAEIGSAFLCARFGIAKSPRSSSIAYLTYWLNKFEEDKWIYQLEKAALLANKACYFFCRKDSD